MANRSEHLDRTLNRPALAGIGISGCVGVGVYVTSGGLITTAGSLGAPISFLVAGVIAASVQHTITEMVTSRPLTGALIDLPHTFLDPAAGFAVAALYPLANIFSMAALTAHSAELTAFLKTKPEKHPPGVEAGINIAFIALTTFSHCLGVKLYGRIERVVMIFKLCLFVLVCIIMIIINVGDYTSYAFPPGWMPGGYKTTSNQFTRHTGVPDTEFGLSGGGGRLFGLVTAVTFALFSCTAGEMIAMTAGEAKEPWKDVPVVISFVYLIQLGIIPFVLMSGAANVNYADPSLATVWGAGSGKMTVSPFVVALQTTAIAGASKAFNFFFIISAYTAGNTALYVSSRAAFTLAQTYLPNRLADIFGSTNGGHTPLAAILLCASFGSKLGAHDTSDAQTTTLTSGRLDRLEKRKIVSRNENLYKKKMFKSRWQPLPAYIGIIGCAFVVVWSGIPPLYIICAKASLTDTQHLKSNFALGFDIFGAWIGPFLFATFYLTYKYITPHSVSVDIRDLTSGDYILGDLAVMEGQDPESLKMHPNDRRLSEPITSVLDHDLIEMSPVHRSSITHTSSFFPNTVSDEEIDIEEMTNQARKEERKKIREILESRPSRMQRSLARELWSCVVAD
ncbi:hypothetical protein DM02DRAFT_621234 [Periconia macrospinosa]|uniref:Amino acid permease/ SLC12A domain-containing protein n=1 Tax=Periconia macrospinosa TaxID=97972 RepID=A0A2V1EFT0_9PLEO|nr:hypothetical protein DM02DRAFT_621234 [Periconia macrospinosa]